MKTTYECTFPSYYTANTGGRKEHLAGKFRRSLIPLTAYRNGVLSAIAGRRTRTPHKQKPLATVCVQSREALLHFT